MWTIAVSRERRSPIEVMHRNALSSAVAPVPEVVVALTGAQDLPVCVTAVATDEACRGLVKDMEDQTIIEGLRQAWGRYYCGGGGRAALVWTIAVSRERKVPMEVMRRNNSTAQRHLLPRLW